MAEVIPDLSIQHSLGWACQVIPNLPALETLQTASTGSRQNSIRQLPGVCHFWCSHSSKQADPVHQFVHDLNIMKMMET